MPCTHRRMSLTATGSFSSPGSIGTPMYWSRSDVSSVNVCLQFGLHQAHQISIADFGVAAGHGDLAVGEEEDVLRNLVAGHPLAQEVLDVGSRRTGAILEDG